MITESGRVVAVEDNCLWVETIQRSTCESCSAQKGCGQSLVAKWDGKTNFIRVLLEGRSPSAFQHHDLVTVGIPERVVANGSLLVYMTPLLSMMLALAFGHWLELGELGSIAAASLGFLIGGALVRFHSYQQRNDSRVQPVLLDGEQSLQWVDAAARN